MAKAKSVPGRSAKQTSAVTEYKPSIYLDGEQIPKELRNCKPGEKINMTVQGVVASKREAIGGDNSMSIEVQKMGAAKKGK